MTGEIILESIEELQQRWDYLRLQEGVEELLVTEDFRKTGNKTFTVIGLSMELEEDYVICDDFGHVIQSRDSVLMMFLRQSLTLIKLIPISSGYRELLEFGNYGTIFIEKLS